MLSIDVEGFDLRVVQRAFATLRKTRILVIEYDEHDKEMLPLVEAAGFRVSERTRHNLVLTRFPASSEA